MKKTLMIVIALVCIVSLVFVGCTAQPAQEAPAADDATAAGEEPAADDAGDAPAADAPAEDGNSEDGNDDAAASGDKKYRIGFANASVSNSWRVKMRDMLMDEAEALNVEIVETDANDDANTQNGNIETLLQQNLDAIMITPVVEDAVNPGIEMAYESGIPVIIFDRHCSTDDFTTFVGYNEEQNGEECAKLMVAALEEKNGAPKGKLIALDSMAGSSTHRLINQGWENVLSEYPEIEIVARQYTDFEVSKGKAFMEDCLTKYGPGEIDGILSQDGGVTLGAMDAIEEAGRDGDNIFVVNADGINGIARLVKEGKCIGFTQFPCKCSVDALQVAIECIEGTTPEKEVMVPSIVVTPDNVDEYFIPDGDDYDWTL